MAVARTFFKCGQSIERRFPSRFTLSFPLSASAERSVSVAMSLACSWLAVPVKVSPLARQANKAVAMLSFHALKMFVFGECRRAIGLWRKAFI